MSPPQVHLSYDTIVSGDRKVESGTGGGDRYCGWVEMLTDRESVSYDGSG